MQFKTSFIALLASAAVAVKGEQHIVRFENYCGFGTPTLIRGADVLASGSNYAINGSLVGAIAYLQTGYCDFNGENCTLLETTLQNSVTEGGGSSTDLSLIPPHAFSVPTAFSYYNGCDGAGTDCTDADCTTAFREADDTFVQVACQENNVNLLITFCDTGCDM